MNLLLKGIINTLLTAMSPVGSPCKREEEDANIKLEILMARAECSQSSYMGT